MTARDVLGAWCIFRAHLPLLVANECLFLCKRTVRLGFIQPTILCWSLTMGTPRWPGPGPCFQRKRPLKVDHLGQVTIFGLKKKKKKENQKNLFILCFLYKKNEHNKFLTSDFQRQQSSSMAVKMTLLCPGIGPVLQSSDDSNLLQWPGIKDWASTVISLFFCKGNYNS